MAIKALVMGFGGTGAHILTYVKEQAVLKYGGRPDSVRFLLFDTIQDWQPGATIRIAGGAGEETTAKGTETSLDPDREYFFLGDRDPNLRHYVYEILAPGGAADDHPHLKDWLHTPWLRDNVERAQMEIVVGAAQQRQIGRFAMFQNARRVYDQIRLEVRELATNQDPVNVWIVGSSAGGTGAGCLLDAAHLTRLAVGGSAVSVTGVIVLPEVYDDKGGISPGRAYSLFRELDRFQRQGIPDRDRYLFNGKLVTSTVAYDATGALRSLVGSKLFDNVFYVGTACRSDDARVAFFTSVASAIDPFLDENAGPPLLERSVNADAAASAFGAARLYVPKESLGELFAWQQVEAYLRGASAFVDDGGHRRLASGSAQEREQEGLRRVRDLSPLFGKILELQGGDDALRVFARTLQPPEIVEEWYGLAAPEVVGLQLRSEERLDLRLTYTAPAYSWKEHDPHRVEVGGRNVKTYSEYRAAARELGLPRQSNEESRDRFASELEEVMRTYKDADGQQHSFEKGRRLLLVKLSQHLRNRVDTTVRQTIEQSSRFGVDEAAPGQGTPLTRLYQELRETVADRGPLRTIEHRVRLFIEALAGEEKQREHEAVQAIQDIRDWQSRLFGAGVETTQVAAREAVTQYLTVYQRDRLLADLQRLVREVRARVEEWERVIHATLDALVIDPGASRRADTVAQVKRLETRLARLAKNPKARISADPDWDPGRPDAGMLGYRQVLSDRCTLDADGQPLAAAVLSASTWRLQLDAKERPQVLLQAPVGGADAAAEEGDLVRLQQRLYRTFRAAIDRELGATDVFDYLFWAERERRVTPEQLARALNEAARPLINATGLETCHLVVRNPGDPQKEHWINSLAEALRTTVGAVALERVPHSDRDSITVFRILKPDNMDNFRNVVECRNKYLEQQREDVNANNDPQRRELKRAQVYHPFRPELEAWYIERRAQQTAAQVFGGRDLLSPRLVGLLDDPAMMQSFVECVSTGAVEKVVDGDWIWHAEGEDVGLTVDEPDQDLIRAAVVFVLQKREGHEKGLRRIELGAAQRSASAKAQGQGTTVAQACKTFLGAGLDALLRRVQPAEHGDLERDRRGLRLLFEFYGNRARTDLGRRIELVHARPAG
jgi:hypothetical protein